MKEQESVSFIFRFLILLLFAFMRPTLSAAQTIEPNTAQARAIYAYLETEGPLKNETALDLPQLRQLYETRAYNPVWNLKTPESRSKLLTFLKYMKKLCEENGLEPQDETINSFVVIIDKPQSFDVVKFDIALTDWLLGIAHELNGDQVNYQNLYSGWDFNREKKNLAVDLGHTLYNGQIYEFLPSLTPSSTSYLLLAQALRLYRAIASQQAWKPITEGPILRPKDKDKRVHQVRSRLESEAYMLPLCQTEKESEYFDDELRKVLISYQSRNGLETDGNIGPETVNAMNKDVAYRINQIRANMAIERALPRTWPLRMAQINIADASIKIFKEGEAIYHAQVVVGLPSRKTPFIQSAIHTVLLNPMWKIPISIARYDILPKLRKDPFYLQKKGFSIRWREEDPYGTEIDWANMKPRQFNYQLRQSPGKKNALGAIKFDFKNKFSVYLHGTPHKEDFVKSKRHLSSGCIRLKDPEKVASVILAENSEAWPLERIQSEIGHNDMFEIEVKNPLPISVVYKTVFFPSEDISAHFRRDVYGYDEKLLRAMKEKQRDYKSLFFQEESNQGT